MQNHVPGVECLEANKFCFVLVIETKAIVVANVLKVVGKHNQTLSQTFELLACHGFNSKFNW